MNIIDTKYAQLDENGIWISKQSLKKTDTNTQDVWENIYNFDDEKLITDRKDFFENKLEDHLKYILPEYDFDSSTVYLEIGCGPSYIGEYLMRQYDVEFVGIDFNYQMLLQLKEYLLKNNLHKFTLIHSDITEMPIKENSIDFIYGGGVIEHIPNTDDLLKESYKILKNTGVSFNTIPAFNLWWLTRFYNNIPALPQLKKIFEWIHIKILNYKILNKYYGYELSYTKSLLQHLHKKQGFENIKVGAFAIAPSKNISTNKLLVNAYMKISNNMLTAPVYYVSAKK